MTYWDPFRSCEMVIANGACLMVRREALEQAGLLEEHIFFGAEDLEWSYRFRRFGWKLYYLAEAAIVHVGGGTNRPDYNAMRVRIYKGLGWFFLTQRGPFQFLLFRLIILMGAIGRMVFWLLMLSLSTARRSKALNEIRGRWLIVKLALEPHLAQKLLQST